MRVATLVFPVLFIAIAYAQTENDVLISTSTPLEEECKHTCQQTVENENSNGWVVKIDDNISYFYLADENVFVIVNQDQKTAVVMDGTDGTLSTINTETGLGFISNVEDHTTYAIYENGKPFDIAGILDEDYSSVSDLVSYVDQYTDKVVGDDIDTTQPGYSDTFAILKEFANQTAYDQWQAFQGQDDVIQALQGSQSPIPGILNELFQNGNYTVEWGESMYVVAVTEQYKTDDPFLNAFDKFLIEVVRTLNDKFNNDLMDESYNILLEQNTIEDTTDSYTKLLWAIAGVNTTYESLDEAMQAYKDDTVVQTYVETIIVTNPETNETTSFVTYNSMKNGTWLFRTPYGENGTKDHYFQITASYYDNYMGIFDPSIDYTMVFTSTNQFGLINYKTGNGIIMDGNKNTGTFVVSQNQDIIDAFASGAYKNGFQHARDLIEGTEIPSDAFDAIKFFEAIRDGEDITDMVGADNLETFENDFSTLQGQLADVDFTQTAGLSMITKIMLSGPKTDFFYEGFALMTSNMFKFQIAGGALYRIDYAGILDSINNNFDTPMFNNINGVLITLKLGKPKESYINLIENYVDLSMDIDVNAPQFTIDGTYQE